MMNCSYPSQGFGIAVDCRTCFMTFRGTLKESDVVLASASLARILRNKS
jgi:hypothetical protein